MILTAITTSYLSEKYIDALESRDAEGSISFDEKEEKVPKGRGVTMSALEARMEELRKKFEDRDGDEYMESNIAGKREVDESRLEWGENEDEINNERRKRQSLPRVGGGRGYGSDVEDENPYDKRRA